MIVVLLSGWARSGKDTVADYLCERYGFHRYAFADPLKENVAEELGIPLDQFHTDAKCKQLDTKYANYPTACTLRDILIQHAYAARARDPDVYSRAVVNMIRRDERDRIVISDWRLRRESDFIKASLPTDTVFLRVRIVRAGLSALTEVTEHELDNEVMDVYIRNDTDIHTLYEFVDQQVGNLIQFGS